MNAENLKELEFERLAEVLFEAGKTVGHAFVAYLSTAAIVALLVLIPEVRPTDETTKIKSEPKIAAPPQQPLTKPPSAPGCTLNLPIIEWNIECRYGAAVFITLGALTYFRWISLLYFQKRVEEKICDRIQQITKNKVSVKDMWYYNFPSPIHGAFLSSGESKIAEPIFPLFYGLLIVSGILWHPFVLWREAGRQLKEHTELGVLFWLTVCVVSLFIFGVIVILASYVMTVSRERRESL